jgi:hypothetical protein
MNMLPSYLTTNSSSTSSSNMLFPFFVTSIKLHKSHKTVFYLHHVHLLLPLPVAPEHSVSLDVCALSTFLSLCLLNLDANIATDLESSIPSYNLVAMFGDPSCACGKSAPPVTNAHGDLSQHVPSQMAKNPASVPSYLSCWLMMFSSKMPLLLWSWKVLASSCICELNS